MTEILVNHDPDGLGCYSDHAHDIQTTGNCMMCGSSTVEEIGHVLPQIKRLKNVDPVRASAIVVHSKGAKMVDGVLLDHFTASAIQAVYNALSTDEARDKLRSMTLVRAADVCFKLINRQRSS